MGFMLRSLRWLRNAPMFVRGWLFPSWGLLGIARLLINTIHFRRLAPCMGHACGTRAWIPLISLQQERRARLIGRTIRFAARHTPWKSNCFPQALAAHALLALYGIPHTLCLGLKHDRSGTGMQAHAWVAAGRVDVTGGRGFGVFTLVGAFSSVSPDSQAVSFQ